jgi:hypothetical protein
MNNEIEKAYQSIFDPSSRWMTTKAYISNEQLFLRGGKGVHKFATELLELCVNFGKYQEEKMQQLTV